MLESPLKFRLPLPQLPVLNCLKRLWPCLMVPRLSLTPQPFQILGPPWQLKSQVHHWSFLTSHGAKPKLLSMILRSYTSHATQTKNTRETDTLSSSAASVRDSLGYVWAIASVRWPWGNSSQKTHLSDAGLFLIAADLSVPADQYQLEKQSKGFTSVILIPRWF